MLIHLRCLSQAEEQHKHCLPFKVATPVKRSGDCKQTAADGTDTEQKKPGIYIKASKYLVFSAILWKMTWFDLI